MTTYIIGNGFDIVHGLDTSFESFRDYLGDNNSNLLYLFDGEDYWSDFERNMCAVDHEAYINIQSMFKGIPQFVNSLFDEVCDELLDFLNKNNYKCKRLFKFKNEDIFLNFNYTPTVVETYDIDTCNVYHIHGAITDEMFDSESKLVLGHDKSDYETNPNLFTRKYEQDYTNFLYYTIKPYDEIMESKEFQSFMERIKSSDRIVVYGLSYGSVDMNYLKYIFDNMSKNIKVTFYYYNEDDLARLNSFINNGLNNLDYEVKCCKGEKYYEKEL